MEKTKNFLFKKVPLEVLLSLSTGQKYVTQISKKVGSPYSHVFKTLRVLEKLDLVTFEKKGRIKVVSLTKKGEMLVEKIEEILKIFLNFQTFFLILPTFNAKIQLFFIFFLISFFVSILFVFLLSLTFLN